VKFFLINVCLTVVMTATCEWLAGQQAPGAIQLRDTVVIDHPGPVLLSDLLPSDAPVALRETGRNVALCRTPQAGTLRVLRAEQVLQTITTHADWVQRLTIPSRITIRYSGRPVSEGGVRDAISEFLRRHGWDSGLPESARLSLPEVAAAEGENFQVTHVQWDTQRKAIEVRLGCSKPRPCGAFLGYVLLPQKLSEDLRNGLTRAVFADLERSPRTAVPEDPHPPLVAKGKNATLILEDATMRISVPVICLESGLLNQNIRVFDKRSRQVFLAHVVGDHLLRASL
jgi:hypothetical protein